MHMQTLSCLGPKSEINSFKMFKGDKGELQYIFLSEREVKVITYHVQPVYRICLYVILSNFYTSTIN